VATLYTHQESSIARTWLLMSVFLVLVIALGFLFAQVFNNPVILYGAIIFSVAMNVMSYWFSDKMILSMVHAKRIERRDQAPELWNIVENLSITAGLPMPKLYVVADPSPNAFATGRNPENAVIAVHTGLMERLNKTELEGVIAHELSHIGNRDILVMTVAVVLSGFVSLLADFFLRMSFFGGRDRDSRAGAIAVLVGVVLSILAPIFAALIRLAISRRREFLADASGALLTRYPEGLASALEKISASGVPSTTAHQATAHLYISEPFGMKGIGSKLAGLFATHPPVKERIRILREMDVT
jgi:heat shock protein HtpX